MFHSRPTSYGHTTSYKDTVVRDTHLLLFQARAGIRVHLVHFLKGHAPLIDIISRPISYALILNATYSRRTASIYFPYLKSG